MSKMNISLAAATSSKAKTKSPSNFNPRAAKKMAVARNVFGDSDNDNDDDEEAAEAAGSQSTVPTDPRAVVNQALRREQAALRERAQKAMLEQSEKVYDYDAAYDTFKQPQQSVKETQEDNSHGNANRPSRYIGELLQSAQGRKLDRDMAFERKIAREQQQEEEQNMELRGKERFVTAAYKRKLEERKLWQAEQDKRHEQEDDVTQKGDSMASFYGNLNQNVSMGRAGGSDKHKQDLDAASEYALEELKGKSSAGKLGSSHDEHNGPDEKQTNQQSEGVEMESQSEKITHREIPTVNPETSRLERRKAREEKVAQAKLRYMKRHGIMA